MRVAVKGREIRIYPEGDQEISFFEDTLGLNEDGDFVLLVRTSVPASGKLAFLETMSKEDLEKREPGSVSQLPHVGIGITREDERVAREIEKNLGEIETDIELKVLGYKRKKVLKDFMDGSDVPEGAEHVSSTMNHNGKMVHAFLVEEIVKIRGHEGSKARTCACGETFIPPDEDPDRELCDKCLSEMDVDSKLNFKKK